MESSQHPHSTDELLSAYIDNALNEDECQQIEYAIASDPEIAWRLESMRHTVDLLREMPQFALPRTLRFSTASTSNAPSSALTVRQTQRAIMAKRRPVQAREPIYDLPDETPGFWRWVWQGVNPLLRNAAATCALLLFVFLVASVLAPQLRPLKLLWTNQQGMR